MQKEQQKVLDTQTQTITQHEKRKSKLEKFREKAESLEADMQTKSVIAAERLRDARMATFMKLQQDKCEDEEPAEMNSIDPTDEDLESIEPRTVTLSSSKCGEKLKAQRAKIEKERRNRKILDETREEAYEKYINAQQARRTFYVFALLYNPPIAERP
jgi:hypothetical protein